MRHLHTPWIAISALVAIACSNDRRILQPEDATGRPGPVKTIALLGSKPGRLEPGVDTVALQRLLVAVPVEVRSLVRATFEEHADRFYEIARIEGVEGFDMMRQDVTRGRDRSVLDRTTLGSRRVDPWSAPLALMLIAGTDDSASSIALRRVPNATPSDILVLRGKQPDVHRLSEALRMLARFRSREGIVPRRETTVDVPAPDPTSRVSTDPARWVRYLSNTLAALRTAKSQYVPGVGTARVLTIRSLGY